MGRWGPATRCARRRAGRAALFVLLIGVGFQPLGAAGQVRCEIAAGRIVSAEGEISIGGPAAGLVQPVAAGAEIGLCPEIRFSWARGAEPPSASRAPVR